MTSVPTHPSELFPPAAVQPADVELARYIENEHAVDRHEQEGILARWRTGCGLLAERERNGGKQLPHGRLDEVSKATKRSRRELQRRMRFAELCKDEDEVRHVCRTFPTWHDIVNDYLPTAGDPTLAEYRECERKIAEADRRLINGRYHQIRSLWELGRGLIHEKAEVGGKLPPGYLKQLARGADVPLDMLKTAILIARRAEDPDAAADKLMPIFHPRVLLTALVEGVDPIELDPLLRDELSAGWRDMVDPEDPR